MVSEEVDDIRPHIIKISCLFEQLAMYKNKVGELEKTNITLEKDYKSTLLQVDNLLKGKKELKKELDEFSERSANEKRAITKDYQELMLKYQQLQIQFDLAKSSATAVSTSSPNKKEEVAIEKLKTEKKRLQEQLRLKDIKSLELENSWKETVDKLEQRLNAQKRDNNNLKNQLDDSSVDLEMLRADNTSLKEEISVLDESCTNLQTQIRIKDEEYVIKPIMREMTYITTLPPILPIPDKELICLREPYRSQAESQTPSSKPLKFSEGIENTILKPMTSPIESDSYSMQQSIEASSSSLTAARKRKRLIRRNRTMNVRFNKRKVVKTVRGPNQLKVFLEPHDKDVIFIDSYKKHRNFYEFRNVTDQMKWFRKYSKLMQSMTSFGPAMFNPMLNPYNLMAMGMGMGMGQPMMEPQFAPFMSQFRNTDVHPTNNNKKKDNRKKSRSRIKSSPIIDDDDNDNDDDDVSEKVVVPSREPQRVEDLTLFNTVPDPVINVNNCEPNLSEMPVIRTDDTYSTYSDNPCPSPNASDTNNICAIGDDLPPSIVEDPVRSEPVVTKRRVRNVIKLSKLDKFRQKATQSILNHKITQDPKKRKLITTNSNNLSLPSNIVPKIKAQVTKLVKTTTEVKYEGFKRPLCKRSRLKVDDEPETVVIPEKRQRCDSISDKCQTGVQDTETPIEVSEDDTIFSLEPKVVNDVDEIKQRDSCDNNVTNSLNKRLSLSGKKNIAASISLFVENITQPDTEEMLNNEIEALSKTNMHTFANTIVGLLTRCKDDILDRSYTPPAPMLTSLQQKLILLVSKLESKGLKGLFDQLLKFIECRILEKPILDVILRLSRFLMAICKLQNDVYRMRCFCIKMTYYLNNTSIPIWFLVLTQWPEVLPPSENSKDLPLVWVIVHFIKTRNIKIPSFNYRPLTNFITSYHKYNEERYNAEELLQRLLDLYERDDSSSCEFSIALLCKNENEEWVKQQIKKKMLPLVTSSSSRYKVLIDRVTTQLGLYDYFMEIQNLLDSSLSEQAG